MTKTTNYEISKKLKEIGFDKETNFYFTEVAPDKFEAQYYTNNKKYLLLKSYELETLLEFAFNNIEDFRIYDRGVSVAEFLSDYDNWHGHYKIVDNLDISIGFKETKISYADAIGKLIILLHEKNLIKF
jgi:hypothetical protein